MASVMNRVRETAASSLRAVKGNYQAGAAMAGNGLRPHMTNSKVKTYPVMKHYQGLPTNHTTRYNKSRVVASGPALSFWFRELNTTIVEVPLDDQELPFIFQARSADFQDVTVQGIVTYRIFDAQNAARRIDFSIDVQTGSYRTDPKVKIESLITQIAQEASWAYLSDTALEELVAGAAVDTVRTAVSEALTDHDALVGTGIRATAVTVSSVKPRADVEKALQVPTFETLQEKADQATFSRRASAVEKERTIQQNELDTQLELAKKREKLLDQERTNQTKTATTTAEVQLLSAKSRAEQTTVMATADAEAISVKAAAEVAAEKDRMDILKEIPNEVLMAVAFQRLAENVPSELRTLVFGEGSPMQIRSNADA